MPSKFLRSLNKTYKLYSISQELMKPIDVKDPLNNISKRKKHIDILINLSLSDPVTIHLLEKHNSNEASLRSILETLMRVAGVQYNNGFFVPASSIIDPISLLFLLEHFNGQHFTIKDYDPYNSSLFVGDKLIQYFKTHNYKILEID